MVASHPAVVNSRHPVTGTSLIQFAVRSSAEPALLSLLLSAGCGVGLIADHHGSTALSTALRNSKWRALRQLLEALLNGTIASNSVSAMSRLSHCLAQMAAKYPRDFLHMVKHMPLQSESEVLSSSLTTDVMLPQVRSWVRVGHGRWG